MTGSSTGRPDKPAAVYLNRVPDQRPDLWPGSVDHLLDEADPGAFFGRNDRTAIKVHVGESGLKTALPPEVAGTVARRARACGALPFFTDTSVLYPGRRSSGIGHCEVAVERGFTLERAGAVFIPADGMAGNLEVPVEISGRHFTRVGVAEAIAGANRVVLVSHATGHLLSGFGATIKNLGMGCASRKGKLLQHSDTKPHVVTKKCTACGVCMEHCPAGAISARDDGRASIDGQACTGCGECLARCRYGAMGFRWDSASETMQEKMAEHALGVVNSVKGKLLYIQGLVNMTMHCDCLAETSRRVAADIGFLLSHDPVAIDQATLELVRESEGRTLDRMAWPEVDGQVQITHAEEIGLGSREYRLLEV